MTNQPRAQSGNELEGLNMAEKRLPGLNLDSR
jgi:hypothetical protein